jgi:hypothetical protein
MKHHMLLRDLSRLVESSQAYYPRDSRKQAP